MVEIVTDDNTVTLDEFERAVRQRQPSVQFRGNYGSDLLKILLETTDDIDTSIDNIYDQLLIETATDEHLEKVGLRYDVKRKTGESDDRLRKRINTRQLIGQSRGTYQDIARVVRALFEVNLKEINLIPSSETADDGTAIIQIPKKEFNNFPFTQSELEDLLSDASIGGHRIVVQEKDVFRFDDPNNGFGSTWGRSFET